LLTGLRVFIPASQVSDRYVKDLNEYLGKTITFVILEFNKQKKKIIGSRRSCPGGRKGKNGRAVLERH
jgi:ribosomal protein S1